MTNRAQLFQLPSGRCHVAPIEFDCSLASGGPSETIKIGALAEMLVPNFRGVGLIARQALTGDELQRLGPVASRVFSRPFDFLVAELEQAWAGSPSGEAIAFFRRRNAGSLIIGSPEAQRIDSGLLSNCRAAKPGNEAMNAAMSGIRKALGDQLERQMLNLIWDTMPPTLANCQFAEPERLAA